MRYKFIPMAGYQYQNVEHVYIFAYQYKRVENVAWRQAIEKKKKKKSIPRVALTLQPEARSGALDLSFPPFNQRSSRYKCIHIHTHEHKETTIYANSFHNLGRANRTLHHSPRLIGEISTQFFLVSKLLTRFCWLPRPFATSLLGGFIDVGDLSENITKKYWIFLPYYINGAAE